MRGWEEDRVGGHAVRGKAQRVTSPQLPRSFVKNRKRGESDTGSLIDRIACPGYFQRLNPPYSVYINSILSSWIICSQLSSHCAIQCQISHHSSIIEENGFDVMSGVQFYSAVSVHTPYRLRTPDSTVCTYVTVLYRAV